MQGKYRVNELILSNEAGPVNGDYNMTGVKDFYLRISYASATAGNFEVQSSSDGIDFVTITDGSQAVVPAGDFHDFNVTNFHGLWLRVVVPAGVTACDVRIIGSRLEIQE